MGVRVPDRIYSLFGRGTPVLNLHALHWKTQCFRQGTNYICYLMFGLRLEGKGSVFFNIQELRMYHLKMTIVQGQMYVSTRWAPTIVINVQWSYGAPINGLIDGFSWGYNPSYRSHFTELQLVMGPTLYKALPIL